MSKSKRRDENFGLMPRIPCTDAAFAWGRFISVQFSHSVMSNSCDPMDCSTSGFPVHHQLPELPETHVLRVGDAIQPSHPCCPLLLLPSIFPSIRVFSNGLALSIRWPKYWSFSFGTSPSNEYSELISCRIDWFHLSSPTPQFEYVFKIVWVCHHELAF